jgi:hypothetical protein
VAGGMLDEGFGHWYLSCGSTRTRDWYRFWVGSLGLIYFIAQVVGFTLWLLE